ncbi:hypothetical protein DCAR_0414947 [Daucus carota subsp. sativus]|uniref:Uncharacterized protein n=1 Tax=Daucus carota subsp. sativus TaxID=79200 RepID=A0A165A433_DAUCS|nr:hypothetical protein DCAR_0414947 [Daucus carota subsp. sativus]
MEDVNVLLVGLPGAGSSTLFKKLLELGDQSMYMEHSVALIERDTKRFYISELPSSYTYEPGLLKWGSLADIAVLIIPGSENIDNNWETLIHTVKCVCCIKALGIPKIVVAVNKIDNLSYSSYNTHQGRGIGVCYNVHYRDEEEGNELLYFSCSIVKCC